MAVIQVKFKGQVIADVTLEKGKEYVAGRAQDANIHLDTQRGISRHHFKLYERDGKWVCETLSKVTPLQMGAESHQVLELSTAMTFTAGPYEFSFDPGATKTDESVADTSENLPAFVRPRDGHDERSSARPNNEATMAGNVNLAPYMRISYSDNGTEEVLKLEGELWVAGRDSTCEIHVNSPQISRRHFELARAPEGYFITDLGSSNGTKLNGQRLPPHEPTRLESGDEIMVRSLVMTFEVRDNQFLQRLDKLAVPALESLLPEPIQQSPLPLNLPIPLDPTVYQASAESPARGRRFWRDLRKNKVRLALVVLAPLLLVMALLPEKKPDERDPRGPAGANTTPSFDKLTKEQKGVVKDSFNLARNRYVQGKYALCLTELAKLHELVPQYENSKELQSFCDQGLELVKREEERQRQQREREEVEQRITSFVDQCKSQLGPEAGVEETRFCLAPAIELAPEHNLVIEMLHTAQMHQEEKKFLADQRAAEDARAAKGRVQFNRAMATYTKGKLARAILEFEKFLSTTYPRSDTLKTQASRQVASIRKELKTKVDSLLEKCRQLGSKNKFKSAYQACDKATDEDPDNSEARELKSHMVAELKREMKAIYEDSVIEESLGNVDSAKEKWKRILQEDLDHGEYANKARSKLKRLGAVP